MSRRVNEEEDDGMRHAGLVPSREEKRAAKEHYQTQAKLAMFDELVKALRAFTRTIEDTGGLVQAFDAPRGTKAPAGDPEWIDLADAYMLAESALAKVPSP